MSPFTHPVGRSLLTFVVASVAVVGVRGASLALASDVGPIPDPVGRRSITWPTPDGTGGAHASALTDIDRRNVRSLEVAWTYRTGDVGDGTDGRAGTAFEATPIVVDATLFVTTPYSRVVALDAETGVERWTFDPGIDRSSREHKMTTSRGLSSWLDPLRLEGARCRRRILTASYDARLFALDAKDGTPCPDFGDGGSIDLRVGVDRIEGRLHHYNQTAPPTVIGDLVVVGSSIFDNHFADAPSGAVRAFDVRTGALRWSWEPLVGVTGVAEDGRIIPAGAANTWATITADPERGLLFVPTGSPSPDHYGGVRPGDNAYANSLVALDAATGQVVWHFQMVHHDLWDYDLPSPPALITVWRAGRAVPAVAQATKMGLLFVFERETGRPLFPVVERPVPPSDVPGEVASPTQPFPLLPRPLVPHALDVEEAWGLTPIDRAACRDRLAGLRNEGIYTPPSLRGSLAVPGFLGGMEWGGVAFSEEAGIVVTNTNRLAMVARLVPARDYATVAADPGRTAQAAPQDGTPYGTVREVPVSPLGLPCSPPPWGMLHAVDASSGEVLWEVPLGNVQDLSKVPSPGAWGSPNLGGPVIAGELIFIAASMDRRIRAFDLRTGEEVWEDVLPASGQATPLTYRARPGGRQYLAIAAGGHVAVGSALGDYIVAYALPGPTVAEQDR